MKSPRFEHLGDQGLLVVFGGVIDAQVNARVHALAGVIREARLPGIRDLVPAYAALAVHYDPAAWARPGAAPVDALQRRLRRLWDRAEAFPAPPPRLVEIPVRYGGEPGPDLEEVASRCGLTPEEVVRRHTAREYRVFMLGFSPGFPYLGGLDPTIAAPRRETPRTRVPPGSVGIAGQQTGIYPQESPGGWQIIGRTPLRLFHAGTQEPCLLRPGDRLKFLAVSPEQASELGL